MKLVRRNDLHFSAQLMNGSYNCICCKKSLANMQCRNMNILIMMVPMIAIIMKVMMMMMMMMMRMALAKHAMLRYEWLE